MQVILQLLDVCTFHHGREKPRGAVCGWWVVVFGQKGE